MALDVAGTATWIWGEVASLLLIAGAFMQILPGVATCLAIVWYVILIYESRTMQRARAARHKVREAAHEAANKVRETAVETAHRLEDQTSGISEHRYEPPNGQ